MNVVKFTYCSWSNDDHDNNIKYPEAPVSPIEIVDSNRDAGTDKGTVNVSRLVFIYGSASFFCFEICIDISNSAMFVPTKS